jgi:predicted PurR-regulated permease PerM
MVADPARPQPLHPLLAAAALVVVVAGLRSAAALVTPFLLALFVAIVCAPPLFALQERRVPTWAALAIVISGVVLVFLAFGTLLGTSVNEFTRALPGYDERFRAILAAAVDRLQELGAPVAIEDIQSRINAGAIFGLVGNLVAGLGSLLTNAFFILLTTVFMLLEAASFRGKVATVAADPAASLAGLDKVRDNVRTYLAIKTGTSLATGVLVAGWLLFNDVDFPLLWGLLAFLFNYVPNIGSIIAAIPGILQALVQLGWGGALVVTAGYLLINIGIGSGVEPRLMGRGAGISTLVAFASLVFWGWVLGPVGMLLSVPLTVTVKIALESNESTHWIGVLLGPSVSEEEATVAAAPQREASRSAES